MFLRSNHEIVLLVAHVTRNIDDDQPPSSFRAPGFNYRRPQKLHKSVCI